jgi:hypothetical protein
VLEYMGSDAGISAIIQGDALGRHMAFGKDLNLLHSGGIHERLHERL